MPNAGTINQQNKLAPCKIEFSAQAAEKNVSWNNETGAALTLTSSTIGTYFNDASGNSVVSPVTIAAGNPGLTIYLKPGTNPSSAITVDYAISNVTCAANIIDTGGGASIQIDP